MEDLLSVDPVFYIAERPLIFQETDINTGACGSIGSKSAPISISGVELILWDNNETGIFDLNNELSILTQFHSLVGDIGVLGRMKNIVKIYHPI